MPDVVRRPSRRGGLCPIAPDRRSSIAKSLVRAALCLFLCLWFSFCANGQAIATDVCSALDNSLIQTAGGSSTYLLRDGKKYHIEDVKWIAQNGYSRYAVHILNPSEVAAIPSGYELAEHTPAPGSAAALEGKLIVALDKVYVVERGEGHWVRDEQWIAESRYAGQTPISATEAELEALPLGADFASSPPGSRMWIFFLTTALFAFLLLSTVGTESRLLRPLVRWFGQNRHFQKWTAWHTRAVLLLFFAAAIIDRQPNLLLHPRFWAEEGTIWFYYASSHSVIQTIFFVYPTSGYYILIANIGAVLSSVTAATLGLEYAPTATTLLAFVIQSFAIGLILFGKSRLFDSLWKAVVGCLIVLFASSAVDEIWLNSINSISFLGLISLLLLFEETWIWPRWLRWGSRGILLLCGLSSPYSIALLPLFVVGAWRDKQREQKIQCLILILCVPLQVAVVTHSRKEMVRTGSPIRRGAHVRLDASMVNVLAGHITYPAVGEAARELFLDKMGLKEAWLSASSFPPRPMIPSLRSGAWLCSILIVAILWSLRGPPQLTTSKMLIGALVLLSSFTCLASLNSVPLARYQFLPGLTFLLLLLINIASPTSQVIRFVCMIVLSYGLAVGILAYQTPHYQSGPSWSTEVQIWHTDHAHPLQVWPSGWSFIYSPPLNR